MDNLQIGATEIGNAEAGMAWWNALPEYQRAVWLDRANSACPADAWTLYAAISGKGHHRPREFVIAAALSPNLPPSREDDTNGEDDRRTAAGRR